MTAPAVTSPGMTTVDTASDIIKERRNFNEFSARAMPRRASEARKRLNDLQETVAFIFGTYN